MNECGLVIDAVAKEDVLRYYQDFLEIFNELQIPWQLWFTHFEVDTGEMNPDLRDALGLAPRQCLDIRRMPRRPQVVPTTF